MPDRPPHHPISPSPAAILQQGPLVVPQTGAGAPQLSLPLLLAGAPLLSAQLVARARA